jgi:hypothetical protein
MNMANKQGVFEEKKQEYWSGNKRRKSEILDAVSLVSGLTRKAAIKCFRTLLIQNRYHEEKRGRPVLYTTDCIAALKEVWEIGSESCGENLHPMISEYIDAAVRDGSWKHSINATKKLLRMSTGSVKRYVGRFVRTRRNFGGKSTTQKSSVISMVPIRMDGWDTAETGVTQIDTVAHCGAANAGDFLFTTNGTDVATLWGSRRAQWNKGQEVTKVSLLAMRQDTPFPWTEIHPDSGNEFINRMLITYAEGEGLRMTRSRPYHKNDNCFVEERNGHVVRAYVGYERLDVFEVVDALNALYDVLTPYLNHFIASRRIVSKERVGAKWKVKREKVAKTPYQRVLARLDVSDEVKGKLRTEHVTLNPKTMKAEIDHLTSKVFAVQRRYGTPRKLLKTD